MLAVWQMTTASKEKLVKQLETQFPGAQGGDIGVLRETSRKRCYNSLLGEMKWD